MFNILQRQSMVHTKGLTSQAPPSQKSFSRGSSRSSSVSITSPPKAGRLVSPAVVFVLLHWVRCLSPLTLNGDLVGDLTQRGSVALDTGSCKCVQLYVSAEE